MERNFSILDADAAELVGSIRISKSTGQPITSAHKLIRCPDCGTEAGKLPGNKGFCPECLKEFRIRKEEGLYHKCSKCGKFKLPKHYTMSQPDVCAHCREMERNYTTEKQTCIVCGCIKLVRKDTGVCYSCITNRKAKEKRSVRKTEGVQTWHE